jgi:predicted cupin superfamily sugar epimerase
MKKIHDKNYWISRLELQVHPEGGFYKEIYRSEIAVNLTSDTHQKRTASTSIYYLLDAETKSFCHRLQSDEIWYYHAGAPVTLYLIDEAGNWSLKICGPNEGEELAVLIPKNTWFGARVTEPHAFVLVSCVVSPGFDFNDFEMIDRNELIEMFPQHKEGILQYTLK